MCGVMDFPEKVMVKLSKLGPFIAASVARKATDICPSLHRAKRPKWRNIFCDIEASIFVQDDWTVKRDVVPYVKLGCKACDVGTETLSSS
jgi:hypothetical protein